MSLHINSPLLHSIALSKASGTAVTLKMDALQPTGSFKIRGVGLACEHHYALGVRRFVSSSGGNAGLAVAYSGRILGVPTTVVVPKTTSSLAINLLRQEDAEVIVTGTSWNEANFVALGLVGQADAFIHPFDDPLLWRGHATIIEEALSADFIPDAVVVAVGGGGLLSGVIEGLQRGGLSDVPVIAAETTGAASLAAALSAKRLVALPAITSVASSLGAKQVCKRAFDLCETHPVKSIQVSDLNAVQACRRFLDDHRILVEPACGAALAVAYDYGTLLQAYKQVMLVVCGGVTASISSIEILLKQEIYSAQAAMNALRNTDDVHSNG